MLGVQDRNHGRLLPKKYATVPTWPSFSLTPRLSYATVLFNCHSARFLCLLIKKRTSVPFVSDICSWMFCFIRYIQRSALFSIQFFSPVLQLKTSNFTTAQNYIIFKHPFFLNLINKWHFLLNLINNSNQHTLWKKPFTWNIHFNLTRLASVANHHPSGLQCLNEQFDDVTLQLNNVLLRKSLSSLD